MPPNPQLVTKASASWGFSSTFKQLSDIQSRQVGALVGALVADSACRKVDRAASCAADTAVRVVDGQRRQDDAPTAAVEGRDLLFQSHPAVPKLTTRVPVGPLRHHSYSGEACNHILQAMAERHGHMASPQSVVNRLHALRSTFSEEFQVATTRSNIPYDGAAYFGKDGSIVLSAPRSTTATTTTTSPPTEEERSCSTSTSTNATSMPLYPICAVMPLIATYPYCDDEPLRDYALGHVLEHIGRSVAEPSPQGQQGEDSAGAAEAAQTLTMSPVVAAVPFALSMLSILMRCAQSNPDPVKNAAFMALEGTAGMFPPGVQKYCVDPHFPTYPPPAALAPVIASSEAGKDTAEVDVVHQAKAWLDYTAELRRCVEIIKESKSYEEGVAACAANPTGSASERALIVGACLGAKYGARAIPADWIDATADHGALCSTAIEVAQWAWNPAR